MDNELEELLDKYMDGNLSEKETAEFERRLQTDEAFSKEYELHSMAVLGVQRKEMRALLEEQETAATKGKGAKVVFFRVSSVLALAACLFIGIFIVRDIWKLSSLGGEYIAQLEAPVVRGGGVEESIALIYEHLQGGAYSEAQNEIDKARQAIAEEQSVVYPTEEETEYHRQMLKHDSDELDWCQALLYVKMHKVFKAKRLLRQIAGSDSRYRDSATAMLK